MRRGEKNFVNFTRERAVISQVILECKNRPKYIEAKMSFCCIQLRQIDQQIGQRNEENKTVKQIKE